MTSLRKENYGKINREKVLGFTWDNKKGVYLERWVHRHGCRRWFNIARDTVTNEIKAVYKIDSKPPKGIIK